MKISWNWLRERLDFGGNGGTFHGGASMGSTQGGGVGPLTPVGLAELLTSRGLEVEEVLAQAKGFENVVTARILERGVHPQADRLSLCKVLVGESKVLEIVCGAQNMKAGDIVAAALVGAELPNGMKIAQSKIRGVSSSGMLCSEEELGLASSSDGILILPPDTEVGIPLARTLGRDDTVLTLKLTANRADCLSHWGMAREVAAALGIQPKRLEAPLPPRSGSPIRTELEALDSGLQFWGVQLEGIKIGPSPNWLVKRLGALGQRSINNLVDVTNWVMLETGHPVHAYDADKIRGGKLAIRFARPKEQLKLLDGSEVELTEQDLVIADAERAVGLAGVMGGGNSEVSGETRNVFLEVAEFAPSKIRKTSTRLQKKTEASHRFERGVDPTALPWVMGLLTQEVLKVAGGKVLGGTSALHEMRSYVGDQVAERSVRTRIRVDSDYFARFLGMNVSTAEVRSALTSLGCEIEGQGGAWSVIVPHHRLDLALPEDLAEEVARSVGYSRIEETLPVLSTEPTSSAASLGIAKLELLKQAKAMMASLGFSEVLNYSFTSKAQLAPWGFGAPGVRVVNPLSEELEWMAPSLLPSLIQNVLYNWHHHFGVDVPSLRLFEIRPTFHAARPVQAYGEMETGMEERWRLSLVMTGEALEAAMQSEAKDVDFLDLKAIVETILETLSVRGARLLAPGNFAGASGSYPSDWLHPGKSAVIAIGKDICGFFGRIHPKFDLDLKLKAPVWVMELDWDAVLRAARGALEPGKFRAWGAYPSMDRDFALVVDEQVSVAALYQVAQKAGKPLLKSIRAFDVYRGEKLPAGKKSVALRLVLSDDNRVLQESETETTCQRVQEAWLKELKAELRG